MAPHAEYKDSVPELAIRTKKIEAVPVSTIVTDNVWYACAMEDGNSF